MVVSLEGSEIQQLHPPFFGGARYNRLINESEDFVEDHGSYKLLSAMGVKKFVQELQAGTPSGRRLRQALKSGYYFGIGEQTTTPTRQFPIRQVWGVL